LLVYLDLIRGGISLSHQRWNVLPSPPLDVNFVKAGISPLLGRILYHRGITEASQVQAFLAGEITLCGDPFLLPGMHQAVVRINRALLGGEKIAIFGDFDTDGVTATALMVEGLALLGSQAIPYIPHRITEGYGLKSAALENLHKQGVTLVISVDCGVTAVLPVKKARRLGMDIVVTDHHVPMSEIPAAAAVIDPKLPGSMYPFHDLSGVGVALKLLQALSQSLGKEPGTDRLLDLVALGTVADMAPLLGENRYLVKQGLRVLNDTPRPGIKALMNYAGNGNTGIESETISWLLAPRLNAAGRLDHAITSYQLLTTASAEEARILAEHLQKKNLERQALTTKATGLAKEQVTERGISPVLVAQDIDFPIGICGLVASRLVDEYYRPAVVVRTAEEFCTGSCRSIPEFNIIAALNEFQSAVGGLLHFGGHAQAAGFTLPIRKLTHFDGFLNKMAAEQLKGLDLRPCLDVDAEARFSELGGDVYPTIQKLSPFGQGNPVPSFLSRGVEVLECRTMGSNNEHLKLKLKQGGVVWNAVGFGFGGSQNEMKSLVDLVYSIELDHWNGSRNLRLNILDFQISEASFIGKDRLLGVG
jgi:single-stranded-DNA-specific exonuclease